MFYSTICLCLVFVLAFASIVTVEAGGPRKPFFPQAFDAVMYVNSSDGTYIQQPISVAQKTENGSSYFKTDQYFGEASGPVAVTLTANQNSDVAPVYILDGRCEKGTSFKVKWKDVADPCADGVFEGVQTVFLNHTNPIDTHYMQNARQYFKWSNCIFPFGVDVQNGTIYSDMFTGFPAVVHLDGSASTFIEIANMNPAPCWNTDEDSIVDYFQVDFC